MQGDAIPRWFVFVVAALGLCCSKDDSSRTSSGTTIEPIERAASIDAREPSLADRLAATDSFETAVDLAKPMMNDTTDEISAGALALAMWGARKLRLADVVLAKNGDETKPALIHKDADRERGKRLCVRGRIVQITKDDLGIFIGLLMMSDGEVVHYLACGDTGDLVERSRARFCGVAIGRYTYANAGGGTTHAIEMVGMFDLPSNRVSDPIAATKTSFETYSGKKMDAGSSLGPRPSSPWSTSRRAPARLNRPMLVPHGTADIRRRGGATRGDLRAPGDSTIGAPARSRSCRQAVRRAR